MAARAAAAELLEHARLLIPLEQDKDGDGCKRLPDIRGPSLDSHSTNRKAYGRRTGLCIKPLADGMVVTGCNAAVAGHSCAKPRPTCAPEHCRVFDRAWSQYSCKARTATSTAPHQRAATFDRSNSVIASMTYRVRGLLRAGLRCLMAHISGASNARQRRQQPLRCCCTTPPPCLARGDGPLQPLVALAIVTGHPNLRIHVHGHRPNSLRTTLHQSCVRAEAPALGTTAGEYPLAFLSNQPRPSL